ncbi:transporter [Actinoplanes sp. NBRC 101535]|nr:transporter [Actinoplanes sp. NBRC 101535]
MVKSRSRDYPGSGAVLLAAVLWGTIGPAQLFAGSHLGTAALAGWRQLVGGLALAAVCLLRRPGRRRSLRGAPWQVIGAAGVIGVVYQYFFMSSVTHSGAALGTLLAVAFIPLFAGVFDWVLHGRRPGRTWLIGSLTATVGCGVLLAPASGTAPDLIGLAWGLLAGATFAGYTVTAQRMASSSTSLLPATAVSMLVGAVCAFPWIVGEGGTVLQPHTAALVAWLGLAATALPYALYARGLRSVSAGVAGVLALAEPVTAAALSAVLNGERLSPVQLAGCGCVLAGLLVVVSRPRRTGAVAPGTARSVTDRSESMDTPEERVGSR